MKPSPDIPQLYTVGEVASMLKLSKWTIWEWIRSGRLNAVKIGKQYRIPVSELHRLLELEKI